MASNMASALSAGSFGSKPEGALLTIWSIKYTGTKISVISYAGPYLLGEAAHPGVDPEVSYISAQAVVPAAGLILSQNHIKLNCRARMGHHDWRRGFQ